MFYILAFSWLALCAPCFFYLFANGADLNFRIHSPKLEDGFWVYHRKLFAESFQLLSHDYFGVYCPWSWETAKRHRLADMKVYLGETGRHHDALGHITSSDCDDPEKQEVIARRTYITRTRHWVQGVWGFITAPINLAFLIVLAIVMAAVGVVMMAWDYVRS